MKRSVSPLTLLLALVALAEYGGVFWWGAVWPWRHGAGYPGDGGMNDYLILATVLLVGVSLAGAGAYRRLVRVRALLLALIAALPLAVAVLLLLISGSFLDPVVYYLALLPSVFAALLPYAMAARLAMREDRARHETH